MTATIGDDIVQGPDGASVRAEAKAFVATRDDVSGAPLPSEVVLPLVEERMELSKRRVATGVVRIATRTELLEETAEVELDRYDVEVKRVPINRVVDEAPPARAEGDTTIVPVMEERLVWVKQLVVKEELHIRHVLRREVARQAVPLRRQRAVVERRDAAGQLVVEAAQAIDGNPLPP